MRTRPTIWNFAKINLSGSRIFNFNTDLIYIDKHTGKECIEINARKNRLIGELILIIMPIALYLIFSLYVNHFNWERIIEISMFLYLLLMLIVYCIRIPFVKFKVIESYDDPLESGYRAYEFILLLAGAIGMVCLRNM